MSQLLIKEIKSIADPKRAEACARYFKTGPGEYGEGDIFVGLTSAQVGQMAKKYTELSSSEVEKLLQNKIHECRSIALVILVNRFKKADGQEQKKIVDLYLRNTKFINNWDLVDISAPKILGLYYLDKDRKTLYRLARSNDLWEKRIGMMSTFAFIRNDDFTDAFKIAQILLDDQHDLIHKAVGWMLREIGKRDQEAEEKFLKKYYQTMPRTMLRYAIERFDSKKRDFYLKR
ncbi:MAG: DNA alkylation repair protein [Patescibacteria group bacterium]